MKDSVHKFHRWRRIPGLLKKNQFFCGHPACYKKLTLNQLHGKVAECPNCETKFIIDSFLVTPEMEFLVCPTCSGKEIKSEAAQLVEFIKAETNLFTDEAITLLRAQLNQDRNDLILQQETITKHRQKLAEQKEKLVKLLQYHRIEFSKHRAALMSMRASLMEREKKVAHKEQLQAMNLEVMADAITSLVKDKLDESNGSSDN